jgi:PKD repeat protein
MNTFLNLYSYSGNIQWQQSPDNITFYNIPGATLDTLTSPAISDTTYFRVVTSINNVCIATDSSTSIQVDVLPTPEIELGSDTVICANNYLLDAGPQSAGTTLQWNNGSTGQTLLASSSGQYYTVGTSQFFCQTRDTINITFKTPVILNTSPDQTICEGDNATLSATGGFTYLWNTSETSGSISVSPFSDSIYTVTAFGINGCSATDSILIHVNANPVVDLGADTAQCGGSVLLSGGSAANSYSWSNGAITSSINVTSGGQYFVEATSINGCTSSDTINVTISPAVNVNLGTDITQCGGNITLNAGNPGSAYSWSNGSGTQTIVVNSSGMYYAEVTNSSGCSDTDTIQVTINPNPLVNLGSDVQSCSSSVTLNTSATGNYLWNTGDTTQAISVSTSGTYFISVDLDGCVASDTISVTISNPPIVNLGADIQSCNASVLLDAGNSGSAYSWNTGATGQTTTVFTSGTYIVNVTVPGGCSVADSIMVTINPTVAANAGPDLTVCNGNSVQLSATGGTTYLWNNSVSGSSITVVPTSDTVFNVLVTDINGCTGTDQLNIFVNEGPTSSFNVSAAGTTITTTNNSLNASSTVWDFGDGSPFNTAFAPSHIYLTDGTYVISLITSNSCGTDTATYVLSVVGTEEELLSNSVKLFPVPTSGILNAEIIGAFSSRISIKLITPDGRLIDEKNFTETSASTATFDLTELSSGIYFMQISNEKTVVNKKIILQK